MKTVVLEQPGRLSLVERERPLSVAADEALVRVRRIGVCGTDLHAFRGEQPFFTYPRVLGHELAVEVAECGAEVSGLKPGDLCAVEPCRTCGRCVACRRGRPNCCVELRLFGVHMDGGMCEWMSVPARQLRRSQRLSLDQLALVEPLAIGAHAVSRASLKGDEWVLVVGAGPIGLSVLCFAALEGGRLLVMDVNENRLSFCREKLGVEHTLPASGDSIARLLDFTGGELPTAVFDATGHPGSMTAAFQYVAHGGRLVFVGLCNADVSFFDPDFHRRETTLLASRNSTSADFTTVMNALEAGRIDTAPWITHRVGLGTLVDQFPVWVDAKEKFIKGVVEV